MTTLDDITSKVVDELDPEAWQVAIEQLQRIAQAPPNWNSYGALAPAEAAIIGSLHILLWFASNKKSMPTVVPMSNGGIQLEWHYFGRDVEIEVNPNGEIVVFFEDALTGEVLESHSSHLIGDNDD